MAYLGGVFSKEGARCCRQRGGVLSWRGLGPSQKNIIFCPQNDVYVHFDPVYNRQKTRTVTRSLGTRILRFNREVKLTKTVQKLSKNSRSDQRGGADAQSPPHEYATVATSIVYHCCAY